MGNPIPPSLLLIPHGDSKILEETCSQLLVQLCEMYDFSHDDLAHNHITSIMRVLVDMKVGEVVYLLMRKFHWNRAQQLSAERKHHDIVMKATHELVLVIEAPATVEFRCFVALTHLCSLSQRAFIKIFAQITDEGTNPQCLEPPTVTKRIPPSGLA